MTDFEQHPKRPSQSQLSYLRDLAASRGESFAYPRTRAEAKVEIERLKGRAKSARGERRRELISIRRALAEPQRDTPAVSDEELDGYGSTASWRRPRWHQENE